MRIGLLLCGWFLLSCAGSKGRVTPPDPAWERGAVYAGMCDASAAAAVRGDRFLVADDEDNLIRVYRTGVGGPPAQVIDPAPFMALDPSSPEADLEGSAVVGDTIYWLSSHGRSSSGKARPSRLQFFATRLGTAGDGAVTLTPIGRPFTRLLEALIADPRLARFGLRDAATRAPKAPGGLNIEGLAATPDGRLLIGFRSPTPEGRALIVPLDNPAAVVDGAAPVLGAPILVDLDGLGVRSMEAVGEAYLIAAGASNDGRTARLFVWDGAARAVPVEEELGDFNPEALFVDERTRTVQLLSDDGAARLGGRECKKVRPVEHRRFRGLTVDLHAAW